tara:strand:+ start:311 stop:502 length:192 start_codon:yes stop_codon:yes gene_type:complete
MWENVFVESRLLSALVFGGFYTHSNVLEEEVEVSDKSIRELSARQKTCSHERELSTPFTYNTG